MLKYIDTKSIIHSINSTVKLITLILLSIYIFTLKDYIALNIIFIISAVLLILSRINIKHYIKALKNSIYFVIITFVLNLFFSDIMYSLMISYRIFIMLIYTLILTLTTKSMDIVYRNN